MSNIEEIVHIIPLGHEFDRVVKPFEKFRANRVYLLTILKMAGIKGITEEMYKKQQFFLERVRKVLMEKGIEVIVKHTNIFDLLDTMKCISGIIRYEKEKGNMVYVNISGAGRLTSVAATLVAMAHGAKAYYVVADGYAKSSEEEREHGLSICKEPRFINIANLRMKLPDEISWRILAKLYESEEGMEMDKIIDYLGKTLGLKEFDKDEIEDKVKQSYKYNQFEVERYRQRKIKRRVKQLLLNKLNKRFLNKLEDDGYIKREKSGRRNMIKITEAGKYIACISGFVNLKIINSDGS